MQSKYFFLKDRNIYVPCLAQQQQTRLQAEIEGGQEQGSVRKDQSCYQQSSKQLSSCFNKSNCHWPSLTYMSERVLRLRLGTPRSRRSQSEPSSPGPEHRPSSLRSVLTNGLFSNFYFNWATRASICSCFFFVSKAMRSVFTLRLLFSLFCLSLKISSQKVRPPTAACSFSWSRSRGNIRNQIFLTSFLKLSQSISQGRSASSCSTSSKSFAKNSGAESSSPPMNLMMSFFDTRQSQSVSSIANTIFTRFSSVARQNEHTPSTHSTTRTLPSRFLNTSKRYSTQGRTIDRLSSRRKASSPSELNPPWLRVSTCLKAWASSSSCDEWSPNRSLVWLSCSIASFEQSSFLPAGEFLIFIQLQSSLPARTAPDSEFFIHFALLLFSLAYSIKTLIQIEKSPTNTKQRRQPKSEAGGSLPLSNLHILALILNPIKDISKMEAPNTFIQEEQVVIKGCTATEINFHPNDTVGSLCLVVRKAGKQYLTDGKFNNSDYMVRRGSYNGHQAYEIHPPQKKARTRLQSIHAMAFKLTCDVQIKFKEINREKGEQFANVWSLKQSAKFQVVPGFSISSLKRPVLIVLVPEGKQLQPRAVSPQKPKQKKPTERPVPSPSQPMSTPSVDQRKQPAPPPPQIQPKTRVEQNKYFRMQVSRIAMPEMPYVPLDYAINKYNTYQTMSPTIALHYFSTRKGKALFYISKEKHVLLYYFELGVHFPVATLIKHQILLSACSDGDHIYYLEAHEGGQANRSSVTTMTMHKTDLEGRQLCKNEMPTEKAVLNMYKIHREMNSSEMAVLGDCLFVVMSRTMTKHTDGMNHQSAICFGVGRETLDYRKELYGYLSSHSFRNSLQKISGDELILMDFGDSYPRGINLTYVNASKPLIASRCVYTMRTCHHNERQAKLYGGFPLFQELTKHFKRNIYKGSNDLHLYGEFSRPVVRPDCFLIFMTAEKGLNNKLVELGEPHVMSRNVAVIKVRRDFYEYTNEHTNFVNPKMILSEGPVEHESFYGFTGLLNPQQICGVVWLTNYKNYKKENAFRPKTVDLGKLTLVLYQFRGYYDYFSTEMLLANDNCQCVWRESSKASLQFYFADDPFQTEEGRVLFTADEESVLKVDFVAK